MTDRPAPLTTPDMDVRDLDGFMLNSERLLASELWATSTGEEFKAAMGLWCRAWKQIPAGSLPDDDRVLASFAAVQPARWKKIKPMAMRGFLLCSDGRYYHSTLCQDVKRGYGKKVERRAQTHAANEARKTRNAQRDDHRNDPRNVGRNVHPVTGQDRTGQEGRRNPDPGDLFTGAERPPIDAFRRVVETDLDHLANAHAIIGREEGGRWQLLVKTHGRDRVVDVIRQVHLGGERAFYSTIRDRLDAPATADTGVRSQQPAPVQTPHQIAERIVHRDGWEACRARIPEWAQARVHDEQTMLLAVECGDGVAAHLIAQSKVSA